MRLRLAAFVLALGVASATPVPLSACVVALAAPEECHTVPHCDQMAMDEPAATVEASLDTSCCQWSTTPAQEPATVQKAPAPEVEFVGVTFSPAVALPATPVQNLPADSPLKVLPFERQALLCVFLI